MAEPGVMTYTVRRLTSADAPAIPELTLRVNGPGYIHAEMYHPERLIRLNRSGELVSVVALDDRNEVVGHYALERPNLDPIAESGEAMVLPEHQHHHLLDRMRSVLEEEARQEHLTGVFGNTVTHHVFSQKTEERFGAHPIAILLGASPAEAHRDAHGLSQRVSLLTYFKFVADAGETAVHAPAHHRDAIERIYRRVGRRVNFRDPAPARGAGKLESSCDAKIGRGQIRIANPGIDSIAQLEAERDRLLSECAVVYLNIPLGNPAAEQLCIEAERLGFFFSGLDLRPASEGDYLRLQFLPSPIDLSLVQTDGEPARELASYVAAERERIARK